MDHNSRDCRRCVDHLELMKNFFATFIGTLITGICLFINPYSPREAVAFVYPPGNTIGGIQLRVIQAAGGSLARRVAVGAAITALAPEIAIGTAVVSGLYLFSQFLNEVDENNQRKATPLEVHTDPNYQPIIPASIFEVPRDEYNIGALIQSTLASLCTSYGATQSGKVNWRPSFDGAIKCQYNLLGDTGSEYRAVTAAYNWRCPSGQNGSNPATKPAQCSVATEPPDGHCDIVRLTSGFSRRAADPDCNAYIDTITTVPGQQSITTTPSRVTTRVANVTDDFTINADGTLTYSHATANSDATTTTSTVKLSSPTGTAQGSTKVIEQPTIVTKQTVVNVDGTTNTTTVQQLKLPTDYNRESTQIAIKDVLESNLKTDSSKTIASLDAAIEADEPPSMLAFFDPSNTQEFDVGEMLSFENSGSECPADITTSILGATVVYPLSQACDMAQLFGTMLMICCGFAAIKILIGGF